MVTRLLIVDDNATVRSGLRMLLASVDTVRIIGEACTACEAIDAALRLNPDIVLMDIGLPDQSGIDATREIKRQRPVTAVIGVSIHEDEEHPARMMEAGASSYIPKRAAPDELITAIQAAAAGNLYYPQRIESSA